MLKFSDFEKKNFKIQILRHHRKMVPCIPIFRRFFLLKSVKTMHMRDNIKNHIVTCENFSFLGLKLGISKIGR